MVRRGFQRGWSPAVCNVALRGWLRGSYDETGHFIAASRRLRLGLDFGALARRCVGRKRSDAPRPPDPEKVAPRSQSQAPIAIVRGCVGLFGLRHYRYQRCVPAFGLGFAIAVGGCARLRHCLRSQGEVRLGFAIAVEEGSASPLPLPFPLPPSPPSPSPLTLTFVVSRVDARASWRRPPIPDVVGPHSTAPLPCSGVVD